MFGKRDTSALPTPGTHAPDFIKPLAYASLAIPVIFLIIAGFWIALRFGSSNINPADVDMNTPEDEEDDDDEEQGEKEGEEKVAGRRRGDGDGQMQPLLEDDEDDDEGVYEVRPNGTAPSPTQTGRKSGDAADQPQPAAEAASSDSQARSNKWKIQPGFSTTTKSLRGKER
ncbi:unnamed protein product [Tilletia controversa]|uniref:Uncharacterized protein n=3 Tax=Tilletia TaxID=13289 RepID=A0A8X7MXU1_9BASI|nr:hypothetical protein CF336_g345 [Tilletia laevis]KAE8203069.1 hypothetical protein CF328_g1855 [Tilletia controversa]KAE8263956.1 hypothetical protein A4X03_0g1298 [Tilletia caries]KAE8207540.1 hypothetical protein CF335_g1068 [Tilletia laevis]KAE8252247.1 hypothetical protein A4X06_0g2329 [Tilletia controversa]